MAKNKEHFLEVFASKMGNVSKACKAAQISRQTYYDWLKIDDFANKVEEVREGLLDFAEDQLLANIQEGKTAEILFYLKTKGKKRGYIERQEFDTVGDKMFEVKIVKNETDTD
jgi:hypothetical protein|tara:strand:+ start:135 stop:473 length:339 start_codon:yes stop_codon:yes gene_type:complete